MAKKKSIAADPKQLLPLEEEPKKLLPAPEEPPQNQEYTVLARRYRPQQFAELIGQEPVAESLIKALESGRVAHAYLFTGARGVGKTSTARILAKALNCVKGPTTTPCDQCDMCEGITSGDDIDVLEIDGASNRGIDEVREIRSNVQFRPSRARYKIYIIDEVHMLTPQAFNALLKTLEEPPPHVKFIFATTEAQKIPITILSRCQRFDFAGIGMAGIVQRLKSIVAGEGMQADDDALELIARRAAGSMRDAQSLLDQLLAFGDKRLTAEQIHRLLGTANEERVAGLAAAVLDRDAAKALQLLGQAVDQGLQLGELLDQLIEYWRDLMVVNCAGLERQALSVTGEHRADLKKQAAKLAPDTILAGMDVLVSARQRMRYTSHGRVLFEMAVVRLSRLEDLVSLAQLAQWAAREGSGAAATRPKAGTSQPIAGAAVGANSASSATEKKKTADGLCSPDPRPLTFESLPGIWKQVLDEVGLIMSKELAKAVDVAIFGPNTLAMRFPAGYNLSGNQYLDANRLAKVEEILAKHTGQTWNLRLENIPSHGVSPAENQSPAAPPETSLYRVRQHWNEVAQIPLVAKAVDLLACQRVQMDEEFGTQAAASTPEPEPGDSTEEA